MRRLPFYYGWIIVAVTFITMGIGVNARTSFSLFFSPIVDEFGWTAASLRAPSLLAFWSPRCSAP